MAELKRSLPRLGQARQRWPAGLRVALQTESAPLAGNDIGLWSDTWLSCAIAGVTVLPYPQGMLASVRRAEQKILDVNGQRGRQLRKSARQLQHVPLK